MESSSPRSIYGGPSVSVTLIRGQGELVSELQKSQSPAVDFRRKVSSGTAFHRNQRIPIVVPGPRTGYNHSMKTIHIAGPFLREAMVAFIRGLHAAGLRARKRTESERKRALIDFSLGHDFREGFRPRPHGCDAFSLASHAGERLSPVVALEKREQERIYIEAVIRLLDSYRAPLEKRFAELNGEVDRAPFALLERQRTLKEAKLRIAGQM